MNSERLAEKARIWRSFAKLSLSFPRNGSNAEVAGFKVFYFDRATLRLLYREIFVRQNYRLKDVGPEPVILDCGANLGMATLFFKFVRPGCRIKCFEPDPKTFNLLQENILKNRLDQVEPFNVALWNENTTIDFFTDPEDPGSLLMSTRPTRMRTPAIPVAARRLSEFVEGKVDFLKLDVEGAEQQVLEELAASRKIRLIKQMGIEYHRRIPGERSALSGFLKILEENGFEYQIVASGFPEPSALRFQDIMIYAHRV